ncbi:hypothetical protein [Dickeya dadantii]|uniref:hypothetical protein n=1 Tax=Dickeya dadantii TaxID=204038 RepID=UPI0003A9849C|nr:hypothetical protein [Dickeya dadantii]
MMVGYKAPSLRLASPVRVRQNLRYLQLLTHFRGVWRVGHFRIAAVCGGSRITVDLINVNA